MAKDKKSAGRSRNAWSTLRKFIPPVILLVAAIGFALHVGFGTLSDFGWRDISLLCPLGALTTMLASKMFVPRALISLVIAVLLIVVLGRSFCGWACPVPLVSKLREAFAPGGTGRKAKAAEGTADAESEAAMAAADAVKPLTAKEQAMLKSACGGSCAEKRAALDSRHLVAGGAVLSAAIFGFPVFCLVCPIGLTFATILLLMRAFGMGDVTIGLVVAPLVLLVEVVFFRKWCHKICPLSALMSLVGKLNRTVQPVVDDSKCLETSRGVSCGACGRACPEQIDVRHSELSAAQMNECTRCRKCADACPGEAISFPLLAKRAQDMAKSAHDAVQVTDE